MTSAGSHARMVYDDFSSDEEVPALRSKWTLGSKRIKLNLLNKEKRKSIKSSTMKASKVLQVLSENKELSVTRTSTTVQPVADEDMAGCSGSIDVNISITPADVIKPSKKLNETYEIISDDEIDSYFTKVKNIENLSDTEMINDSSINLEENDNQPVQTESESFDEWLKNLNAKHKAYMEKSRKSINDILQKYASVPKVCADNETPSYRSSTNEDRQSESDTNYNKTDLTSNNKSIDPDLRIENNSKPLNKSKTTYTNFEVDDISRKTPDKLNTDYIKQNVAESLKMETFDEWVSKRKSKYTFNFQILESTVSKTLNKKNEENILQSQKQPCQDWLTNHKTEESQVITSNENIVLRVNNKQNQFSLDQPSCSKNQITLDCEDKDTLQESVEKHLTAPQNEVYSSDPDLILTNLRMNRLETDLRTLQNSIEKLTSSKLKNDLTETKKNDEDQETLDLPDITTEQNELIDTALDSTPPDKVLIEKFKLKIYKEDLETLSEHNWLNDKVIDFYMNLIMQRSEEQNNLPKVYAMNTLFYPKLMKSGHAGLKRWTRKVDIFAYDLLVIPVHLTNHWCVSFINFQTRKIEYLDSRGKSKRPCLIALLQYLKDEHQDKKGVPFDDSGWETECLKDIPEQMNSSDCGIFVCTFAEFSSRNAVYTFTQAHMPYLRRKAALEILTGKLLL
ncbi:sentrin-specific protease-like isoform X2 [Spodoptera litura]|uniref:Sentrin-specific protease-like isoform X2 n=1 Tax=Spodoptera litura TaxID=69820 RepID=A0A9J7DYF3_SPOLT|nr:sentrin-specific protease-like isoform X2 [Spodoptera litura]